jgi:hypothetical protein
MRCFDLGEIKTLWLWSILQEPQGEDRVIWARQPAQMGAKQARRYHSDEVGGLKQSLKWISSRIAPLLNWQIKMVGLTHDKNSALMVRIVH